MIRTLVLICTVGAAATAPAMPAYAPVPSFAGPHPAVVRVMAPERDGASFGSGALVAVNESSGLVVTNWHVVRDAAGPITVFFSDGFRSGAVLLRTDRDWDLAALAIRRPNVQPIAVSNVAPQPGEELTIAGYGSGSYRAVTGRCTQYVSPGGNQPFEMIELSAPARNGDSGGPILNNRGELAGVLFGSSFGRTAGTYCGRLRWFLGSADGDFQRISSQALLAQQSRQNPPPVAAINSTGPLAGTAPAGSPLPLGNGQASIGPPLPLGEGQCAMNSPLPLGEGQGVRAAPAYTSVSSPASRTSLAPVASAPTGPLPTTDQIKTVLAAFGVIAVLYHALRLLGWAVG